MILLLYSMAITFFETICADIIFSSFVYQYVGIIANLFAKVMQTSGMTKKYEVFFSFLSAAYLYMII